MTIDNFQNTQPTDEEKSSVNVRRQKLLCEYAGSVELPSSLEYDRARTAYLDAKYGEHLS